MEHRNYKVIYRRYASLFFLVGVDGDEVSLQLLATWSNLSKRMADDNSWGSSIKSTQ